MPSMGSERAPGESRKKRKSPLLRAGAAALAILNASPAQPARADAGLETLMGIEYVDGVRQKSAGFLEHSKEAQATLARRGYFFMHGGNMAAMEALRILDDARKDDAAYIHALSRFAQGAGARTAADAVDLILGADRLVARERLGIELGGVHIPDFERMREKAESDPLLRSILSVHASAIYRVPMERMNALHDAPPEKRLAQIKGLDARTLFAIMRAAETDAYLSTFQLLYDGRRTGGGADQHSFLARAKAEYGSLSSFFAASGLESGEFCAFVDQLQQYNLVEAFLHDLGGPQEQIRTLDTLLFTDADGSSAASAVAFLSIIRNSEGVVRDYMLEKLRRIERSGTGNGLTRQAAAGIILAHYLSGSVDAPEWAAALRERYGEYLPKTDGIRNGKLFRVRKDEEINVQSHVFYDDRKPGSRWDGHESFRSFIRSLGGEVKWDRAGTIIAVRGGRGAAISDKGGYVEITQRRGNRAIVLYANKPDRPDSEVAHIHAEIAARERPHILWHRGHSYHVEKTLSFAPRDVALLNLGSCGGNSSVQEAVRVTDSAHIMLTQDTGTARVNNEIAGALDEMLLHTGAVDWASLRARIEKRLGHDSVAQKTLREYRLPDQNDAAALLRALDAYRAAHQPHS